MHTQTNHANTLRKPITAYLKLERTAKTIAGNKAAPFKERGLI